MYLDPGRQTNADLDLCQTLKSQTVEFLNEKYTKICKWSTSIPLKVKMPLLNGRKLGLFVNFSQIQCIWIQIQISIPNRYWDPDPGQLNECGSTTVVCLDL
jgi:hypothetical protein